MTGHSERIDRLEGDQPLRRRLLQLLSSAPTTTKDLAARLEVYPETISRRVSKLRGEGLVESSQLADDGREWQHRLTTAGEVELSRHLAYGAKPEPVRPAREAEVEFLRSALDAAVEMRRHSNQLGEAESRLQVVLREARKLGEGELVVEAIAELTITQRQNRKAAEVAGLIEELETIASGKSMFSGSTLVLPALAHHQYALGKADARSISELSKRADHLISSASLFEGLAAAPQSHSSQKWREREAWSLASLANNLRARSQIDGSDGALEKTAAALRIFEELEDPYGRSHCLFQFGFCLRLLGEFEGAWKWLSEAQALATEHSFERFQADSLMQIGEVLRCRGELDEAQAALEESRDRSVLMGLGVTQAFAHSALGAVAFDKREYGEAQNELWHAEKKFERFEHDKGLALNSRRRAVVARLLWSESKKDDLERVERMVELARANYQALHIPAGEIACEIERGRLRLMRDGEAPETVRALSELIDVKTSKRDLVELDPWVPRVLESFAEKTDDRGLIERARHFLNDADRSLGELARRSVRRATEIVGRGGEAAVAGPARQPSADLMGGESRQELDAIELNPAEPALV
jgi:DNA-binding MarR family transcriptional regulator